MSQYPHRCSLHLTTCSLPPNHMPQYPTMFPPPSHMPQYPHRCPHPPLPLHNLFPEVRLFMPRLTGDHKYYDLLLKMSIKGTSLRRVCISNHKPLQKCLRNESISFVNKVSRGAQYVADLDSGQLCSLTCS